MKVATFTVRATARQSARWKQAAQAQGHASVGSWLAHAADEHLRALEKGGRPVPLAWRQGYFLANGMEVRGVLSYPFGIYRVIKGQDLYSLVYVPTGRVFATLAYQKQCKALASELASIWVRWDGVGTEPPSHDPAPILDRHQRESL